MLLNRLLVTIRRWRGHQRLLADLAELSPHQLEDIGVDAAEVQRAAPVHTLVHLISA